MPENPNNSPGEFDIAGLPAGYGAIISAAVTEMSTLMTAPPRAADLDHLTSAAELVGAQTLDQLLALEDLIRASACRQTLAILAVIADQITRNKATANPSSVAHEGSHLRGSFDDLIQHLSGRIGQRVQGKQPVAAARPGLSSGLAFWGGQPTGANPAAVIGDRETYGNGQQSRNAGVAVTLIAHGDEALRAWQLAPGRLLVRYGQVLEGLEISSALVLTSPTTDTQKRWIAEHLVPCMTYGVTSIISMAAPTELPASGGPQSMVVCWNPSDLDLAGRMYPDQWVTLWGGNPPAGIDLVTVGYPNPDEQSAWLTKAADIASEHHVISLSEKPSLNKAEQQPGNAAGKVADRELSTAGVGGRQASA